jgi:L-lactate dehydrogenase complex protein LldF
VRIDIPRMLLALRRTATAKGHVPAWLKAGMPMYRRAATRPWLFRAGRWLAARLSSFEVRDGWIARLRGPLAGWTKYRDFPPPARESFSDRWRRARAAGDRQP